MITNIVLKLFQPTAWLVILIFGKLIIFRQYTDALEKLNSKYLFKGKIALTKLINSGVNAICVELISNYEIIVFYSMNLHNIS